MQNGRVVDVFTRWLTTTDDAGKKHDEAITYVLYSFIDENLLKKKSGGSLNPIGESSSKSELWRLGGAVLTTCRVLSLPFASSVALDFEQPVNNPARGAALALDFLVGTGDGVVGLVRLWDKNPLATNCATVIDDVIAPTGEETGPYRAIDTIYAGSGPVEVLKSFRVNEAEYADLPDYLYGDYRVIVAAGSTPKCMKVGPQTFFGIPFPDLPAICTDTSVRLPSSGVLRSYQTSRPFYPLTPNPVRANAHEIANGVRDIDVVVNRVSKVDGALESHLALGYEGRSSLNKNQLVYSTNLSADGQDLLAGSGTLVGKTVKENFNQTASFSFYDTREYALLALRKIGLRIVNHQAVVSALGMRNNYDFFHHYWTSGKPSVEQYDRIGPVSGFSSVTWDLNNSDQVIGVCGSTWTNSNHCNTTTEILPGLAHLRYPNIGVPAYTAEFRLWSSIDGSSPLSMESPLYSGNVPNLPDGLFTTRRITQDPYNNSAYKTDVFVPGEKSKGLHVQDYRVDRVMLNGAEALIHLATFADVNYGRDEAIQRQMVNGGVFFCIEDNSRFGDGPRPNPALDRGRNCLQQRVVSDTPNASGFAVASASQLMVNQTYLAAPSMTRYSVSPHTSEVLLYYVSMNNAISVVNASDASKRWDSSGPNGWLPLVNGRSASCWAELQKPSPPAVAEKKGFEFSLEFFKTAFNVTVSALAEGEGGPIAGYFADLGLNYIEDALLDMDKDDPNAGWLAVFNQIKMNTACGAA